jgi:hypothetical protein
MPMFLLSFLGFGKSLLGGVVGWFTKRTPGEIAAMILFAALALFTLHYAIDARHYRKLSAQEAEALSLCQEGRAADRAAYAKAQADAAALNKVQVERVKSEQQEITQNAENRYNADLARLRAQLAAELQQSANAAHQGASGGSGLSDLPNAAAVPDDPSRVSIPKSLYVRGAELELQLERLQQWICQQVAIDPNTGASAPAR